MISFARYSRSPPTKRSPTQTDLKLISMLLAVALSRSLSVSSLSLAVSGCLALVLPHNKLLSNFITYKRQDAGWLEGQIREAAHPIESIMNNILLCKYSLYTSDSDIHPLHLLQRLLSGWLPKRFMNEFGVFNIIMHENRGGGG